MGILGRTDGRTNEWTRDGDRLFPVAGDGGGGVLACAFVAVAASWLGPAVFSVVDTRVPNPKGKKNKFQGSKGVLMCHEGG